MIQKYEDAEYSVMVAELMIQLDQLDDFILKIWTVSELPFTFQGGWDFLFLQEGLKVDNGKSNTYVSYDSIIAVKVIYDTDAIRWERS